MKVQNHISENELTEFCIRHAYKFMYWEKDEVIKSMRKTKLWKTITQDGSP